MILVLYGPILLVLARAGGAIRRLLRSGRSTLAIVLSFAALAGFAVLLTALRAASLSWPSRADLAAAAKTSLSWSFAAEVAVCYMLLWLLLNVRANNKLVILATTNHAGKEFAEFASGFSIEFANRLSGLSGLYKTIDNVNPAVQPGSESKSVAPRISVDSPGALLADVVGETSKVSLGPLAFPIRPLVAAVEKLSRRRLLSISLHRNGNRLTMLADMMGQDGSWATERELPPHATDEATASALVELREELAYAVFATLVSVGTRDWQATKHFSEGLRAYRRALKSDFHKHVNLRDAEESFLTALSFDQSFARCLYNLGIVYLEMDNYFRKSNAALAAQKVESAKAAFRRTLYDNPMHADAAYALASIFSRYASTQREALEFADRAIASNPLDSRPWNLKGFLWRRLQTDSEALPAWASSLKYRKRSAELAWRDLCREELHAAPEVSKPIKQAVAASFSNLAVAMFSLKQLSIAKRLLRMAIGVSKQSNLYFELAKIEQEDKSGRAAETAYRDALLNSQSELESTRYQIYLVNLYATTRVSTPAQDFSSFKKTIEAALELPSLIDDPDCKDILEKALAELDSERCAFKAAIDETKRHEYKAALSQNIVDRKKSVADLLSNINKNIEREKLGNSLIMSGEARDLTAEVGKIDEMLPREVGLRSNALERVAERYRMGLKFLDAIPFAENAIALDPFSACAIRQTGLIQLALANHAEADKMLRRSFALNPSDPNTLEFVAMVYLDRGAAMSNPADRAVAFRRAITTYSEAIPLTADATDRGRYYFWLGRFYGELRDYDRADESFAAAKALGSFPVECHYFRACCKIEQQSFDLAEEYLLRSQQAWDEARRSARLSSPRWWGSAQAGVFADDRDLPLHFLIVINLAMALVYIERGGDLDRARRRLDFVSRLRRAFDRAAHDTRGEQRIFFFIRHREIAARHEACLGLALHVEGREKAGFCHLERSAQLSDNCETHYYLARAYLAHRNVERASAACGKARETDTRGVFETRIAWLEAQIAKATP